MVAALLFVMLQDPHAMLADPQPVERVVCDQAVEMPMIPTARRCPVIGLTIGGKSYKFALDTGAQGTRINKKIAEDLGLQAMGQVRAGDPSGKNSRTVNIYRIPEVDAGAVKLMGVFAFGDDGPSVATFDGVLSYGVFKDLILSVDYPGKKVTVRPGALTPAEQEKSLPFKLRHGILSVGIQVGDLKLDADLDTGSDGGLLIPSKYKTQLPIVGEPRVVGHARTLFNMVDIYAADINGKVLIAGQEVPVKEIEMHDLFPGANVGSRLLQAYKVTFDLKNRRFLLQ